MRTDIVVRTKHTESQTQLAHSERAENVRGLFKAVKAEAVEGRHIMIVDDVATTGSTIVACAEAFAEVENVKISVLTLAFARD